MTKHFPCLSDSQWEPIKRLVNWSPPPQRGVPRADFRKIWNSILYLNQRLLIRWERLPEVWSAFAVLSLVFIWLQILLGKSYDLSESACYRSCRWVEDTLIKSA